MLHANRSNTQKENIYIGMRDMSYSIRFFSTYPDYSHCNKFYLEHNIFMAVVEMKQKYFSNSILK